MGRTYRFVKEAHIDGFREAVLDKMAALEGQTGNENSTSMGSMDAMDTTIPFGDSDEVDEDILVTPELFTKRDDLTHGPGATEEYEISEDDVGE
jgi:hypothetical protein